MKDLTARQQEILEFIAEYMTDNGRSPTQREIGERFRFSHNAARDAILALVRKGYLEKGDKELRSLAFPRKERLERENIPIPFFPSEPSMNNLEEEANDKLFIPRYIAEKKAFAFRVTSESMRNAGILPGDIAIMIKENRDPDNNEIILSSYSDDDKPMELRRFHPIMNEYAELWPDNDTMGIIKVTKSTLVIAGILKHIWRSFDEPHTSRS